MKEIELQGGVDHVGEALAGDRGQRGFDEKVDVGVGATGKLGRHVVGAEERGCDPDRVALTELARDAQHLRFDLDIKAIAGLDLDRGYAFGHEPAQALRRSGEEILRARRARRPHRRQDAALGCDCRLGGALEAHLEIAAAIAGEDNVGVAIDQARRDPAALRRVDRVRDPLRMVGESGLRTHPGNAATPDADRPTLDRAVWHPARHRGEVRIDPDRVQHGARITFGSEWRYRPRARCEGGSTNDGLFAVPEPRHHPSFDVGKDHPPEVSECHTERGTTGLFRFVLRRVRVRRELHETSATVRRCAVAFPQTQALELRVS